MSTEKKTNCIEQRFSVPFSYNVYFTKHLFDPQNPLLNEIVRTGTDKLPARALVVLDKGLTEKNKELTAKILSYHCSFPTTFSTPVQLLLLPGGEACKNDPGLIEKLLRSINDLHLCRHSFVIAVGGGALLDLSGYAAAIAHRGIRFIRVPTTVLSQNDSGVGVKNGINYFNKKNFLGTFAPPFAVINDSTLLDTLDERDWRSGIAEAVKVALIKDEGFFSFLERSSYLLKERNRESMEQLIYQCAKHHLDQIASGDPFEIGSSRPLDFGHWSAHKLEQITKYEIRHGEAVAIGIGLDCIYSCLEGHLSEEELYRILSLLKDLGFRLFLPEMRAGRGGKLAILEGLEEFREHLGGHLTVMLLDKIGQGREVHEISTERVMEALDKLEQFEQMTEPVKYEDG